MKNECITKLSLTLEPVFNVRIHRRILKALAVQGEIVLKSFYSINLIEDVCSDVE